jgi:FlaA1/EpsC-like NDP-sugar epimerase
MRVLVTGSSGYIGQRVTRLLESLKHEAVLLDLPEQDILNPYTAQVHARTTDACIHLAAHKHAPLGEEDPYRVAHENITGTMHVAHAYGPNVVFASTCKAADAMTCYGASKFIGERIVLNAGGRVVRLVNVLGSTGSVLDTWSQLPADAPLPVTDCERHWITDSVAAAILVAALHWPAGRYAPDCPPAIPMRQLADRTHPGRGLKPIPLRRGDRPTERLVGEYETSSPHQPGVIQIHHPADIHATAKVAA